MGITNLLPIIKKSAPHLLRNLPHPTTLAGTRLAVDGHMLLHRFWYAPKPGASPLGPNGRPNHHVQYFNNFLELCDHLQVLPTIVFDYGVRPQAKQRVEHRKRAVARSRQMELHRTAQSTVDGLERHLDMLSIADKDQAGQAAGSMGYQHLPVEALETEESRLVERTLGLGVGAVQETGVGSSEVWDLPHEPVQAEEMRMLEQEFALKEQVVTVGDELPLDAALGRDAAPEPQVVIVNMQKNSVLEAMSQIGHFFLQQLESFRSQPSGPAKVVFDSHHVRPSMMERRLSPEELARNRSQIDLPPSPPPPPPLPLDSVPPATPPPTPPVPISQHGLNSLQLFLGDLIQSTSPPARPPSSPTSPTTPPSSSSVTPPTNPTAILDDIKLPRTNIHRLLATTLTATTQPTFNPIPSLSSARSQAHLESLRLERTAAGLPPHVLYDILLLLRARAVPTVLTPNFTEAEQLCGALAHLRVVDFAVSDDSDTGVFYPDAHVIRSFFQYTKRPFVLGPMRDLAVALALVPAGAGDAQAKRALVDFSILAGCDYSGKIPGVGPMNAIKLLKQFGSIEAILDARPDLRAKVAGDESWDPYEARAVFNNEYLDMDVLLELVNEAAEMADMPLTSVDHRVPEAFASSSFWSHEKAGGRAPNEVEVLEAMGIRAFDPETYVQNLVALEPQV